MKKNILLTLLALVCQLPLWADCTVYYAGSYSTPYVYAWTGSNNNHVWPGVAMTATSYTYNGYTVYSYTMTTSYANCIFNDNGNPQTDNLTTTCGSLYYNNSWVTYTPGETPTPTPTDTTSGSGSGSGSGSSTTPTPIEGHLTGNGVPSECEDVMLQGFYWDSYTSTKYGRTRWIDFNNTYIPQIAAAGFTMVWVPSPVESDGGLGYHPKCWSSLGGGLGTSANLKTMMSNFHQNGIKVLADIVVNHRANSSSWCDFKADDFGSKYASASSSTGKYQFTNNHIVSDDEAITGGHCTTTGNADSGVEAYAAARDLDHTNTYVRDAIKSYLAFLQGEVGFDGWRFDLVKSYGATYLAEYVTSSTPYLSVTEYYDGSYDNLKSYLGKTSYHTMTFDFASKFYAFNGGIDKGTYTKLKYYSGKLFHSTTYGKYAVTFIDNHDTFERSDQSSGTNEFIGYNVDITADANKKLILQANAYMLSMPGVPCVFWPHWYTYKTEIAAMIAARKAVGVHSESAISNELALNSSSSGVLGYYEATVQGHNGTLCIQIGPGIGNLTDKSTEGYTLSASGTEYKMWVKLNATAVENTTQTLQTHKCIENGHIVIYSHGHKYDAMGHRLD